MAESKFKHLIEKSESEFDTSKTEDIAAERIKSISQIANVANKDVITSEFLRLSESELKTRKIHGKSPSRARETAPPSVRRLLSEIYKGKCQITGFGFLKKNGEPYFEIHHIKRELGNHLKNLLVLCPNAHAQYEYAKLKEYFDKEGWLRRVLFNDDQYHVRQFIDNISQKFTKEVHIQKDS